MQVWNNAVRASDRVIARSAVGRVGALAVSLGVGAAVLAMPGLAAADTEGSDGAASTTGSAAGSARSAHHPGRAAAKPSAPAAAGEKQAREPKRSATRGADLKQQTPDLGDPDLDRVRSAAAVPDGDSQAAETIPATRVDATSPGNGGSAAVVTTAGLQTAASSTPSAAAPRVLVRDIIAQNQAPIREVFHTLMNWVSTLPVNPLTSWLEGGLLMVRKSFFNQTAAVSAVQTTNSAQLVTGKIDITDPEGDGWKMEVVSQPSHGTVVLGTTSQANGIGSTKYTYTPGQGYTGEDQFVVKVTPTDPTLNIADPFGVLNSQYYTVLVGNSAEAGKTCFNCLGTDLKNTFDTHLYLRNAGATVTVKKEGVLLPKYQTTVTLSASAANRSFDWMDTRGRRGTISVDQMLVQDWTAFEDKASGNATKPLLAFNYSDQGTDKSVFVEVSSVTKNADGSYQFTGQLMADTPAQEGRVDTWDFLGINYKKAYENFLSASGLDECNSGDVCSSTTAVGILGATTLSANAFREAGGHDYALPKPSTGSATQTTPGAMGPGTTGVNEGNGTAVYGNTGDADINQTAMIPWGNDGSFITASNLTQGATDDSPNGIFMYTANGPGLNGAQPTWTKLQLQNSGWDAAVNVMARFDQVATDADGNPLAATFTGTVGINDILEVTVPSTVDLNGIVGQAVWGDGIPSNTVVSGFISTASNGVSSFTVNNPISSANSAIWVDLVNEITVTASATGTANTSNQLTLTLPEAWMEQFFIGATVSAAGVADNTTITGFVSTTSAGSTYTTSSSLSAATSPIAVIMSWGAETLGSFGGTIGNNNLLTLSVPGSVNPGSLIGETITGDGIPTGTVINGFVAVGSGTNIVYTVSNPITASTSNITVTTPNIPRMQPGLVIGLSDGSVQYWNGNTNPSTQSGDVDGWIQLQASNDAGWGAGNAINTLITLPGNNGFVVGLSNGAVFQWNNGWSQLQGLGWDTAVNVMIPSGSDGGFVLGLGDGAVMQYNNGFTQLQNDGWGSGITTMIPYDGTTLVGAISGGPVIATNGVISTPSYASLITGDQALAASTAGCQSNYGGGSGAGCSGYVLTVQEAAGNAIRVGQTLYGGAGLVAGTTILEQISDGAGNLCSSSCNSGGTGVYLVSSSQLVAPGTPMSASDGTGFVLGLANGAVMKYDNGFTQLQNDGWGSGVNTMIPWRDGFVLGLNNGATMYWDPDALTYTGNAATSAGFTQLQGTGWSNAVTSMVPLGDGFALGLTASDGSVNGAVELYTGFGPVSTTAAFGYQESGSGPVALTAVNGFTEIGPENALSAGSGSVQLMFPVNQYTTDSNGNQVLAQTLVAGLTNNGIYAWTGTNQDLSQTSWNTIQDPGTGALTATMLQAAWQYGQGVSTNWGAAGGVGATYTPAAGSTAASGDPVFGLQSNQAWCGTSCSGDYVPFAFNYPFGNDGVIWSAGTTLEAEINLASMGYGYIYIPSGIFDKFEPDKYSVAALLAVQGGPSLVLNPPDDGTVDYTKTFTGPSYTYSDVTEVGTFSVGVGLNASLTGEMQLNPNAPTGPLVLASASYTPGLLYTWNTNGNTDAMGITFAAFPTVSYLTPTEVADYFISNDPTITASAGISPYVQVSYGLETPGWFPISIDIFDLTVGYENPITATATIPLDDVSDTTVSLNSQGIIYADAGFLPSVTSLLSWSNQYQVYSVTDQLFPS